MPYANNISVSPTQLKDLTVQIKKGGLPRWLATVLTITPYKIKLGEDIAKKTKKNKANAAKNSFAKDSKKNSWKTWKEKIMLKKLTVGIKKRKIQLESLPIASSESDEDPDQLLVINHWQYLLATTMARMIVSVLNLERNSYLLLNNACVE